MSSAIMSAATMSPLMIAEMLCLGAVFGGFGGLFGVGGGIIAIPTLVLAFDMDQQTAQGTAMVMMLPTVVRGFYKYQRRNNLDMRMALLLAASAVIATYVFARIANMMSTGALRSAFGVFLVCIAVYLAYKVLLRSDTANSKSSKPFPWSYSWIVGVVGAHCQVCSVLAERRSRRRC